MHRGQRILLDRRGESERRSRAEGPLTSALFPPRSTLSGVLLFYHNKDGEKSSDVGLETAAEIESTGVKKRIN